MTLIQKECCACSSCEEIHHSPRVEAVLYEGTGQKFLQAMCRTDKQLLEMFSCSYCTIGSETEVHIL